MTFKSRTKFADLAARLSDAIPSGARLRPFKILFRSNLSAPSIGTACAYRTAAQNLTARNQSNKNHPSRSKAPLASARHLRHAVEFS